MGIKYSGNDPSRVLEYLKIRDYKFSVLVGADKHFLQYMISGCDGTVSGCAGVFPEIFAAIYDTYCEGRINEALQLQRKANEIIEILKAGTNLSVFKEAQQLRGLTTSHVRQPLMDISYGEKQKLADKLKAYL